MVIAAVVVVVLVSALVAALIFEWQCRLEARRNRRGGYIIGGPES